MYKIKPSTVIINGINGLGLEIAKKLSSKSNVVVVGDTSKDLFFPKHISIIDTDSFRSIKFSSIKNIIILYHEKQDDLVSASDLVSHAKYLSDIFSIATANNARTVVLTSFGASRQYTFSKYTDRDQPYDFPSFQNLIEKLTLEQNRRSPSYVLRVGDAFGASMSENNVITRMVKDVLTSNSIRVDDDGLDKLFPVNFNIIAENISLLLKNKIKGGVYSIAPKDGLTQLTFANICMQYSNNISSIKFIKARGRQNQTDPMYENMYNPAPYLDEKINLDNLENDVYNLIKEFSPITLPSRISSKLPNEVIKHHKIKLFKINKNLKYALIIFIIVLFLLSILIPTASVFINTKLLTGGNEVFFDNYNKSAISELNEDVKYNTGKSKSLKDAMGITRWLMPFLGDSYTDNQNFLDAETAYFDALSFSSDYKFVKIDEASRSVIQIKLQTARSLIRSVNKNKLFWNLTDQFDSLKKIIDDTSV